MGMYHDYLNDNAKQEPRSIIYNFFDGNDDLCNLINYLDIDTLVAWFVDENYVDMLDDYEAKVINKHYELHC